jgi:CheY-like chemotaxis protein
MGGNILVVDDEQIVRDFFVDVAQSLGGNVETAEDGDVAVEKCRRRHFDIIFMDMRMPHMSGLEACKTILSFDPATKVVIMSGFAEDQMMDEAINSGAMAKISKPFELRAIVSLIETAEDKIVGGSGGSSGEARLYILYTR